MRAKIAVATVSGKAYYKLVKELKGRGLPFLSLKPRDSVPLHIKVVITTKRERHLVTHPNVLIFEEETDAATVVNEAIRVVHEKQRYERVVIGVDPGKTFGVAIIGDGKTLGSGSCSSSNEAVNTVLKALDRVPATISIVKIGNGAPVYSKELLHSLDEALPKEAIIQVVREAGTSQLVRGITHRRGVRDVVAAIKIAERKGRVFPRRRRNEAGCGKG